MRRLAAAALTAATFLMTAAAASGGHGLDHFTPGGTATVPGTTAQSGPTGAWQFIATIPTGNPHTDLDYFTQGGEIYASVGTLAAGGNDAGQTIIKLTKNGQVIENPLDPDRPHFVSGHGSADCISDPSQATGLQHDVEATPKGNAILNTDYPFAVRTDAQLLVDTSDNPGRCHDNGAAFGFVNVPQGGLELIDITNINMPVEIGLTSHIGESHTTNVDPKRPHIAYSVTSDFVGVTCNADDTSCTRANESPTASFGTRALLDGFEVVDMSSCMNFPAGTTLQQKRAGCRPQVYRYRYPSALMALGHSVDSLGGCHELEIYPDDKLTCASINATMYFDMSGAFDSNGKPKGTPLPCRVRPTTSNLATTTGAMVTDCVIGENNQDLTIPGWLAIGAPSLEGVKFLGAVFHQGRVGNTPPPLDATQDVEISHEAELSGSGKLILTTDERGGGVLPPGAACVPSPGDNTTGNGGIHAFRVSKLQSQTPSGVDTPTTNPAVVSTAHEPYALTPNGDQAIYRAPIRTQPQATLCTSHVFHQIPGQNRIFMAWYSQGTQVVDFIEHPNGRVEFIERGFFIPTQANEWVSAVFKMKANADGTFTYWGATGDFGLGTAGRSAIDIYKVTLPAPPKPLGQGGGAAGDRTTGGGWLAANGGKINFGFNATETASGFAGNLELSDKGAPGGGVKIHMSEVTSLGAVDEPCGSVKEGPSSLQFTGSGTSNGSSATFRVCVRDGGEGPSASPDLFYLECSCGYNTGMRTGGNDEIDGGNIQVRRSTAVTSTGASSPTTLILEPVLLSQGVADQTQLFTVKVYDQNQEPLANASVTLTKTTPGGATQTLTGLTGLAGTATILVTNVAGVAEYTASAGGVQSNAVEVTSLLG